MMLIAITQRVVTDSVTGERRDALDQRWTPFLQACGLAPLLIPNHVETARQLMQHHSVCGVLLTGGNDLAAYGGDAPERDATELFLIEEAEETGRPILGVCRGMQMLQHHAGVTLQRVLGHVAVRHTLQLPDGPAEVNSFHGWGATATVPGLNIIATADDGVVEAVVDRQKQFAGIMWHPERESPFRQHDLDFVRRFFTENGDWECEV